MFCKYCGYELPDDAVFCPGCGKKLDTDLSRNSDKNIENDTSYAPSYDDSKFEKPKSDNEDENHKNNETHHNNYYKNSSLKSNKNITAIIIIAVIIIAAGIIISVSIPLLSNNEDDTAPVVKPNNDGNPIVGTWKSENKILNHVTKQYSDVYYHIYNDNTGYEDWYNTDSSDYSRYKFRWAKNGDNKYTFYYDRGYSDIFTMENKLKITDSYGNSYFPTSEYYDIEYVWHYNGYKFTHNLRTPKEAYNYYINLEHNNNDLTKYTSDKYNRDLVAGIADSMKEEGSRLGFDEYEKVMMAVTFVQSLPYTSDKATTGYDEYVRYPIETLVDNGGDCEDSSILTAALIREMGYGAVLLQFKDHVAVGVKGGDGIRGTYFEYRGDKYYYIETTGDNWEIGEIPDEYKYDKAEVIHIS